MQTPKMSLRRNNILAAYKSVIDHMYKTPGSSEGELEVCVCVSLFLCITECVTVSACVCKCLLPYI